MRYRCSSYAALGSVREAYLRGLDSAKKDSRVKSGKKVHCVEKVHMRWREEFSMPNLT